VLADAEAMIRGYHSVRPLSEPELAAFEVEAALGCLRFATTRITDFELRRSGDAPPGRDFRRFLGRLAAVEAGALGPIRDRLRAEARLAPAAGRTSE
jgi:Ser/Thr protein kinase RdoA (MazF antagonist)